MKKLTNLFIALTVIFSVSTVVVNAQVTNMNGTTFYDWNLKLPKGKMITISKKRFKEMDSHSYHFKATKGQNLHVQLISKAAITFEVLRIRNSDKGDEEVGSAGDEDWSWEGDLNDTGEYRIMIHEIYESSRNKNGTYILKVQLD